MKGSHTKGYILLETVVALLVLSIGGLAINRALHQALLARAQARDYTRARFLLDERLSLVEMQPVLTEGSQSGRFEDEFCEFAWTTTVSKVLLPMREALQGVPGDVLTTRTSPVRYMGKVRVTVQWHRAGQPFERSVETLVAPEKLFVPESAELLADASSTKRKGDVAPQGT